MLIFALALRKNVKRIIIPIGSKVVPFYGSYLESYKVIPKRNYLGAYGYLQSPSVDPVIKLSKPWNPSPKVPDANIARHSMP